MTFFYFVIIASLLSTQGIATLVDSRPSHIPGDKVFGEQIKEIHITANEDGVFELNFDEIPHDTEILFLKNGDKTVATVGIKAGKLSIKAEGNHDFLFRGSSPLKSAYIVTGGNVTFGSKLSLKESSLFDITGKCHFEGGICQDNPEALLFLKQGEFQFSNSSQAGTMIGLEDALIQVNSHCDLSVSQLLVGEVSKISFRNKGMFKASLCSNAKGQFKSFDTGADSQTIMGTLDVNADIFVHRGHMSVEQGNVTVPIVKNLGMVEGGNLTISAYETINKGLFKLKELRGLQGKFHNTKNGVLEISESFTGNFTEYRDFGKSYFHGLAQIGAKKAWISGLVDAYAFYAAIDDYLFVHKDTDLKVQKHITLSSQGDQDLEGNVTVRFRSQKRPDIKKFSSRVKAQLNQMAPGAFFTAKKNLKFRGKACSKNSSVIMRAGEKYSEVGSKIEAGIFKKNDVHVFAKHADMAGDVRSYNHMTLSAESAKLHGTRKSDGNAYLDVKGHLEQLENDLHKAEQTVASAKSMKLDGDIHGHFQADAKDKIDQNGHIHNESSFKGKKVKISGQMDEQSIVTADETIFDNTKDVKKIYVQGRDGEKTGTLTITGDANIGSLQASVQTATFDKHSRLQGQSRHIQAVDIDHQQNSKAFAEDKATEIADNRLHIAETSHIKSGDNVLIGRNIIGKGHVEAVANDQSSGNNYIEAKKRLETAKTWRVTATGKKGLKTKEERKKDTSGTTVVKVGHEAHLSKWEWFKDFIGYDTIFQKGGQYSARNHIFDIRSTFWNTRWGDRLTVETEKNFTLRAKNYFNIFGPKLSSGDSFTVEADFAMLSLLANIESKNISFTSAVNVDAFSLFHGSQSITRNATLLSLSAASSFASINRTETGLFNWDFSLSIPSYNPKEWTIGQWGALLGKTALKLAAASQIPVVSHGTRIFQLGQGLYGITKACEGLFSTSHDFDDLSFMQKVNRKSCQALDLVVSAISTAQTAYNLGKEFQFLKKPKIETSYHQQSPPKSSGLGSLIQNGWAASKKVALQTVGSSYTKNNLWSHNGGRMVGGQKNVNALWVTETGTDFVLSRYISAGNARDTGHVYTFSNTVDAFYDITLGGTKYCVESSVIAGGNIHEDSSLNMHGDRADFKANKTFISDVGALVQMSDSATVTADKNIHHSGRQIGSNVSAMHARGVTHIHNGGQVSAPKGNTIVGGDKGVTLEKASFVNAGSALPDLPKESELITEKDLNVGQVSIASKEDVSVEGTVDGKRGGAITSDKALQIGENAVVNAQDGLIALKGTEGSSFDTRMHMNVKGTVLEMPGLAKDIYEIATANNNSIVQDYMGIYTSGHVVFDADFMPQSNYFDCLVDDFEVNDGVGLFGQNVFSLQARDTGRFRPGSSIDANQIKVKAKHLIFDVKKHIGYWTGTGPHHFMDGKPKSVQWDRVNIRGGKGTPYQYKNTKTGLDERHYLSVSLEADTMTGVAPEVVGTNDILISANIKFDIHGDTQFTFSRHHNDKGKTREKNTAKGESQFLRPIFESKNGDISLISQNGVLTAHGALFQVRRGGNIYNFSKDDLSLFPLLGEKRKISERSYNGIQRLSQCFHHKDKNHKKEKIQPHEDRVVENQQSSKVNGTLVRVSEEGMLKAPSIITNAPGYHMHIWGEKGIDFDQMILSNRLIQRGYEWRIIMPEFLKKNPLPANPKQLKEWLVKAPIAVENYKDIKRLHKQFYETYSCLKNGAEKKAFKKKFLKELFPEAGVRVDRVETHDNSQFLGHGFINVGSVSGGSPVSISLRGMPYFVGYDVLETPKRDHSGVKLEFSKHELRYGASITTDLTKITGKAHIGFSNTVGDVHTTTPVCIGEMAGKTGKLILHNTDMKVENLSGKINEIDLKTLQNTTLSTFGDVAVGIQVHANGACAPTVDMNGGVNYSRLNSQKGARLKIRSIDANGFIGFVNNKGGTLTVIDGEDRIQTVSNVAQDRQIAIGLTAGVGFTGNTIDGSASRIPGNVRGNIGGHTRVTDKLSVTTGLGGTHDKNRGWQFSPSVGYGYQGTQWKANLDRMRSIVRSMDAGLEKIRDRIARPSIFLATENNGLQSTSMNGDPLPEESIDQKISESVQKIESDQQKQSLLKPEIIPLNPLDTPLDAPLVDGNETISMKAGMSGLNPTKDPLQQTEQVPGFEFDQENNEVSDQLRQSDEPVLPDSTRCGSDAMVCMNEEDHQRYLDHYGDQYDSHKHEGLVDGAEEQFGSFERDMDGASPQSIEREKRADGYYDKDKYFDDDYHSEVSFASLLHVNHLVRMGLSGCGVGAWSLGEGYGKKTIMRNFTRRKGLETALPNGMTDFQNQILLNSDPRFKTATFRLRADSLDIVVPSGQNTSVVLSELDPSRIFPEKKLTCSRLVTQQGQPAPTIPKVERFSSQSPFLVLEGVSNKPYYTFSGTQIIFDDLRSYSALYDIYAFSHGKPGTIYGVKALEKTPLYYSFYSTQKTQVGFMNYDPHINYGHGSRSFIAINKVPFEIKIPKCGYSRLGLRAIEPESFMPQVRATQFVVSPAKEVVNIMEPKYIWVEEMFHNTMVGRPELLCEGAPYQIVRNAFEDFDGFLKRADKTFDACSKKARGPLRTPNEIHTTHIPEKFTIEHYVYDRLFQNLAKIQGKKDASLNAIQNHNGKMAVLRELRQLPDHILAPIAEEHLACMAQLTEAGVDMSCFSRGHKDYTKILAELNKSHSTTALPSQQIFRNCSPSRTQTPCLKGRVSILNVPEPFIPLEPKGSFMKLFERIKNLPKVQKAVEGAKTMLPGVMIAAELGFQYSQDCQWMNPMTGQREDGFDSHDALARLPGHLVTKSAPLFVFYTGLAEINPIFAVAFGLGELGSNFLPDYSKMEINADRIRALQAVRDRDIDLLKEAQDDFVHKMMINGVRELFQAPRKGCEKLHEVVEKHVPGWSDSEKKLAEALRYLARRGVVNEWNEQIDFEHGANALAKLFGKNSGSMPEPYIHETMFASSHFAKCDQAIENIRNQLRQNLEKLAELWTDHQIDMQDRHALQLTVEESELMHIGAITQRSLDHLDTFE